MAGSIIAPFSVMVKLLVILCSLFLAVGCTNDAGGEIRAGDTVSTALPQPDTTYFLSDTDDYNKPSPENVPLDAPPQVAPADTVGE